MDKKPLRIADFTEDEIKQIHRGLNRTLDVILPDLLNNCEPRMSSIPRSEAIEVVLDADYLEMYGLDRDKKPLCQRFRQLDYKDQIKVAKQTFTCGSYGL
jgi:hypothetical protein